MRIEFNGTIYWPPDLVGGGSGRVTSLQSLQITDIDLSEGWLTITSKDGYVAIIPAHKVDHIDAAAGKGYGEDPRQIDMFEGKPRSQ